MPAGCFASLSWNLRAVLSAGCRWARLSCGGILPAPAICQIQRELEGLQKRIDEVGPAALRRDSQRRLDALHVSVENAEGLPAIFARHMTDKTGKNLVFCSSQAHMKRVLSHAKAWFGQIDP